MNFFQTLILGAVEGITEFLPVSSTFHLIMASRMLGVQTSEFVKLFEVFIQSGAILAVVVLYMREVQNDVPLMKRLFVSFVPTAIVGFVLYKVIKNVFFENYLLTLAIFFIVGVLFVVIEYLVRRQFVRLSRSSDRISYRESILIGSAQALAVVPGVSRAGAVMVGMMLLGYKREESVKYSFLLSVPTIIAASIFDLYKSRQTLAGNLSNIWLLAVGFVVSFLVAYVVIRWFIGFVKKNTLELFGYYRILLAIILLVTLWFRG